MALVAGLRLSGTQAAQGAVQGLLQRRGSGFSGVGATVRVPAGLQNFCCGGRVHRIAVGAQGGDRLGVTGGQLAGNLHLGVQVGVRGLQLRRELGGGCCLLCAARAKGIHLPTMFGADVRESSIMAKPFGRNRFRQLRGLSPGTRHLRLQACAVGAKGRRLALAGVEVGPQGGQVGAQRHDLISGRLFRGARPGRLSLGGRRVGTGGQFRGAGSVGHRGCRLTCSDRVLGHCACLVAATGGVLCLRPRRTHLAFGGLCPSALVCDTRVGVAVRLVDLGGGGIAVGGVNNQRGDCLELTCHRGRGRGEVGERLFQ